MWKEIRDNFTCHWIKSAQSQRKIELSKGNGGKTIFLSLILFSWTWNHKVMFWFFPFLKMIFLSIYANQKEICLPQIKYFFLFTSPLLFSPDRKRIFLFAYLLESFCAFMKRNEHCCQAINVYSMNVFEKMTYFLLFSSKAFYEISNKCWVQKALKLLCNNWTIFPVLGKIKIYDF